MGKVNETRQILMNELGLTRESVRTEMENIVVHTLEKHITKMLADGSLREIVGDIILKQFNPPGYTRGHNTLKEIIEKTAKEEVLRFIRSNVTVR